jgi:hypothetical protein
MQGSEEHAAYVVLAKKVPAISTAICWQARCPVCGRVGQSQAEKVDAEAIAVRHREIGGFEREGGRK